MQTQDLINKYQQIFKSDHQLELFFSPGRVNLIGEHIDYNGGYVLPCALTLGTYAVVEKRNDSLIKLYSENFKSQGIREIRLDENIERQDTDDWTVYVKGVLKAFIDSGYEVSKGFNAYIEGNLPNGAGLSSSASLEMLVSQIIKQLNHINIDTNEMVNLSKQAENNFVGVNCGVMDQFVIGLGKKDAAILLNCNTLDYQYVPLVLNDYDLVIMNTNKKRGLADSKYNERRKECDTALSLLKQKYDVHTLCELSSKQLEEAKTLFNSDVVYKRALHVVGENERVLKAIKYLKNGHIKMFGQLMNESHQSLKQLYEVTGFELDTIVELAWKEEAVIGARMTGAGFGGCAIALVKKGSVEDVISRIGEKYHSKVGIKASFYVVEVGDGVKVLKN